MAKRRVTVYEVKKVSVNVCENESVDVRCGGPRFVGYDFDVCAEVPDEVVQAFIREALRANKRPCESIHISSNTREVPRRHVWTRKRIAKEIREQDVTVGTPYERSAKRYSDWVDQLPPGHYKFSVGGSFVRISDSTAPSK